MMGAVNAVGLQWIKSRTYSLTSCRPSCGGVQKCAHVRLKFYMGDLCKMLTSSCHQFPFCLAHILSLAPNTFNAIDQVRALTRDVDLGFVGAACGRGYYGPTHVKYGTISALLSGADVAGTGVCVSGTPGGVGMGEGWKSVLALTSISFRLGGLLRPTIRLLW